MHNFIRAASRSGETADGGAIGIVAARVLDGVAKDAPTNG